MHSAGPAVSRFGNDGWTHYDTVESDWAEGFRGALDNFVGAIEGSAEPLLTGEEGREVSELDLIVEQLVVGEALADESALEAEG